MQEDLKYCIMGAQLATRRLRVVFKAKFVIRLQEDVDGDRFFTVSVILNPSGRVNVQMDDKLKGKPD